MFSMVSRNCFTNQLVCVLTQVGLWNIKTEAMEVMLAHPCRVCKVVGVDEKIVVTIAEDGVLRIWDRKRPPYHHDLSLFTGFASRAFYRNSFHRKGSLTQTERLYF